MSALISFLKSEESRDLYPYIFNPLHESFEGRHPTEWIMSLRTLCKTLFEVVMETLIYHVKYHLGCTQPNGMIDNQDFCFGSVHKNVFIFDRKSILSEVFACDLSDTSFTYLQREITRARYDLYDVLLVEYMKHSLIATLAPENGNRVVAGSFALHKFLKTSSWTPTDMDVFCVRKRGVNHMRALYKWARKMNCVVQTYPCVQKNLTPSDTDAEMVGQYGVDMGFNIAMPSHRAMLLREAKKYFGPTCGEEVCCMVCEYAMQSDEELAELFEHQNILSPYQWDVPRDFAAHPEDWEQGLCCADDSRMPWSQNLWITTKSDVPWTAVPHTEYSSSQRDKKHDHGFRLNLVTKIENSLSPHDGYSDHVARIANSFDFLNCNVVARATGHGYMISGDGAYFFDEFRKAHNVQDTATGLPLKINPLWSGMRPPFEYQDVHRYGEDLIFDVDGNGEPLMTKSATRIQNAAKVVCRRVKHYMDRNFCVPRATEEQRALLKKMSYFERTHEKEPSFYI